MLQKIGFIVLALFFSPIYSQVGINTTTPSSASVLDVESASAGNYGGMLIPRVSPAEKALIPATAADDGLMVFLIDGNTRCVQIWDGFTLQWGNVYCMFENQAPVANGVSISGTLEVGEVLTANFTYTDAEGDAAGAHTYTWYRADDASGTNQTQIQTGTSNTYTLTASELNLYIAVEVTPVAITGTSPGTSVLSSYFGAVVNPSTGGIFISEIADPNNDTSVRFVEVTNGSANPIDVSGWELFIYFNTNSSSGGDYTFPPSTTIAGGASYIIARNGTDFQSVYGFSPDAVGFNINSNGDDNFELRDDSNVLIDIYGEVGVDQSGSCAEFEDGRALRHSSVIEGSTLWDESEWIVRADSTIGGCTDHANNTQDAPADFSPGTHPN